MPIYLYKNTETEEVREIFQSMNETHEYFGESGKELDWVRVYTPTNHSMGSKIDPNNPNEFLDKTANQKGTYGDLLDQSKELSEKRKEKNGGIDPVKENYYRKYSESRNGAKHPEELKEKFKGNENFSVDWD